MRSTFHGLEVSKRGIFAQQSALNTVSHNIANANTEGYTRQRANMQATTGIPHAGLDTARTPGLIGTGVEVTSLQRIREDYLDIQYRNENKRYGYWADRLDSIQKIEDILNEPSETGLQKVMDQMWQAWQDLAKDPTNPSIRSVVRERSIAVADTFGSIYTHLQEVQMDLDNVLSIKVLEVNSLAQQIANLNQQIGDVVPHGYQPNDLYDQRDVLIDKLSKLTDVRVTQGQSGMVNITMEGQPLVTGGASVAVTATKNPATNFYDIALGGAPFVPTTGSLAATYNMRGVVQVETVNVNGEPTQVLSGTGVIPDLLKRLDTLAVNLTKEINELHKNGLSLTDIKNGTKAEIPFFVDADSLSTDPATKVGPKSALKIKVNPAIIASLDAIAAAQPESGGSAAVGNNSNALAIAAVKFKMLSPGPEYFDLKEASTLDDYYRYTIGELGVLGQEAERNEKNSEMIVGLVENQRQSVSGVSIDDEMAEMVKYQHAYSAAARVLTSVDELLDKVINGMGRVGL